MRLARSSGILCHPTCFPSRHGIGDLGQGAYDFVDWAAGAGQKLWQILPLGPTGYGDSPYQCFSAFAGNPNLISPDQLAWHGLLPAEALAEVPPFADGRVDYGPVIAHKACCGAASSTSRRTAPPSSAPALRPFWSITMAG
jgi:4-alpha-glucanotransferase